MMKICSEREGGKNEMRLRCGVGDGDLVTDLLSSAQEKGGRL